MSRRSQRKIVEKAAERSLERALREERLGLAAIAKVFVAEAPEPGRLLARLDSMARAAEVSGRVPLATRRALIDGAALVRNAIMREIGKPQQLLDPHVGHTRPAAVEKLVPQNGSVEQLDIFGGDNVHKSAEAAYVDRTRTLNAAYAALVVTLRQGPATDEEIARRYGALQGAPSQSRTALLDRRKELVQAGRIKSNTKLEGVPLWQLIEYS